MTAHERERLSAWLDGELPPAERAEVEAHLAVCEECAALLADMGAVDEIARNLPAEAPSEYFQAFPGRVRARIERPSRAHPAAPPTRWRMPVWTWAAAAVLLLAVVTPLTLDRLDRDEAPPSQEALVQAPKMTSTVATGSNAQEEQDEAVPADPDRAPEAQGKGEARGGRRLEDRAGEPQPAFAAAPPPEPALGAASRPETPSRASGTAAPNAGAPSLQESRARERRTDAPGTATSKAPVLAEGEALEETLTEAPELRRQVGKDDIVVPDTAPAPVKGRVASPQAMAVQGDVASAEKKVVPEDAGAFARLASDSPSSAAAWRERREEWRAFATAHPQSPRADESRVRVIEAGLEAWRAGGDPDDLARARADADAYLDRADARLKERVRRSFDALTER